VCRALALSYLAADDCAVSSESIVGIAIALGTGAAFLAYFEPKFYQRAMPTLIVLATFVFFGLGFCALYNIRRTDRDSIPVASGFLILLGVVVYFFILSALADYRVDEQRKKKKSAALGGAP